MRYLCAIVCLIFLASCSSGPTPKKIVQIDVNSASESADLPKLEIESITPLETNESSLFGNLQSMLYFNDKYYLLDPFSSKSVLMFSKDGKYLNKTIYGRGPGEMTNPFAVSVNSPDNKILVWDQMLRTMFTYDPDLNFISRKTHNDFIPFTNFEKLNDGSILTLTHYDMEYVYGLYSSEDYSLEKRFIEDTKYNPTLGVKNPISNKERTLFVAPFDYNIYQLKDKEFESEIYFDFGKYNISKEELEKYNLEGIITKVKNGQKVSSPTNLFESENYIVFHVAFVKDYFTFAYNTATEKVYPLSNYFKHDELPKCSIQGSVEKDTFYATVEPQDLIDFQNRTGKKLVASEIDPSQNPFVIVFNISEP